MTTDTKLTCAEVLRHTLDTMNEDNWTKHHYVEMDTGNRCLWGHLERAESALTNGYMDSAGLEDIGRMRVIFDEANPGVIPRTIKSRSYDYDDLYSYDETEPDVEAFNDAEDTTFEDVVLATKRAYALAEEKGW